MAKAAAAAAVARVAPWPDTATADQLGALLDISGRRVRELAAEGVFPRAAGGRYAVLPCVHAFIASLRSREKAKPVPDPQVVAAALDGRQQRARLAKLQADRVELEIQRERGQLVDAEAIKVAYVTLVTQARNRLLAVPGAAKGHMPHLTVDEIEMLEELIARALEEVADGDDEDDAEEEP
jgi:phage terminase Nu1 subunit (DNA packaging protein)